MMNSFSPVKLPVSVFHSVMLWSSILTDTPRRVNDHMLSGLFHAYGYADRFL